MKSSLVFAGVAVSMLCAEQVLNTRYGAEQALRIETSTELELEVTDMQMTRDGEPVEGRGGFGGGGSSSTSRSVVLDRYLEVAGEAPAKVQRIFEELAGESVMSFGGEDRSLTLESPFEGLVVEIARDEDGETSAEVVEGSGPAVEVLNKLRPELALDGLLPTDAVAEGQEWSLEAPAVRRALGLEVVLFQRPEGGGGGERGGGGGGGRRGGGGRGMGVEQQLAAAEWSGKATFKGLEDFEGVSCARIALAFEAETENDDGEGNVTSFTAKLEGSLWVDVGKRRPMAMDVEGTLATESDSVRERDGSSMEIHRASEGTLAHHVRVGEAAFERE